ncbi:MAG TPA: 30S ribosomal protein S17 [Verrucomicrobiae bacterium]|nr:30S ribosomal protein S17 [Verrucomicrobiae bacterium]
MADQATIESRKRELVGEVVSDKMDKTIVVEVSRRVRHPRYRKVMTLYKKFYAHDEKSEAGLGDTVRIVETRPLSKLKRWRLAEVVEKATRIEKVEV